MFLVMFKLYFYSLTKFKKMPGLLLFLLSQGLLDNYFFLFHVSLLLFMIALSKTNVHSFFEIVKRLHSVVFVFTNKLNRFPTMQ